MRKWYSTLTAAYLLTFASTAFRGNEEPLNQREAIAIDSRPFSQEQMEIFAKEEVEQLTTAVKSFGVKQKTSKFAKDTYVPLVKEMYHHVGQEIFRQDGSKWRVNPEDLEMVASWEEGDLLAVRLYNTSFTSTYKFQMINQRTGESARANAVLGHTHGYSLARIDRNHNYVMFGHPERTWEVDNSKVLETWQEYDRMIVGLDNGLLSSIFRPSTILIQPHQFYV